MRHRFIFDVSRLLLLRQVPELVTVLRAEVDDAGIDLVLSYRRITRHIQMKTLAKETTGNPYAIAESLSSIGGGCVVWMCYDRNTLEPSMFHFLGATGNALMRDLGQFPQATRNKKGVKIPRPGYRNVKIKDADHRRLSLERLVGILFDIP